MIIDSYKCFLLIVCFIISSCHKQQQEDEVSIRQQIIDNGLTIRNAFSDGDLEKLESLHHPDVIKALGYDNVKNGRKEVLEGLEETMKDYSLEFVKNELENMFIQDDLVIAQGIFAIRGTPKAQGDPFVFEGRTLVTYIRYSDSPSGWATIREIIQPATE